MLDSRIAQVKQDADILAIIGRDASLKRIATTRGGEWAGPCPFCGGADRFRVQPDRGLWWCRQCSPNEHWQDVIAYVQKRDGVDFQEAVSRLDGKGLSSDFQPVRGTTPQTRPQAEDWPMSAAQVVTVCEAALWSDNPQARGARAYLYERGLNDDTLRVWRIGYNPESRKIAGLRVESGVTIPYFTGRTLHAINVRRPAAFLRAHPQADKYKLVTGSRRVLFGTAHIAGRTDIIITEGEFDALLIWQEARDLVNVLTMGSATNVPAGAWLAYLVNAQRFTIATDNDAAGNASAAKWLDLLGNRATRVTVPDAKDVTEYWQHGGNVRQFVIDLLPSPVTEAEAQLLALLDEPTAHTDLSWPSRYAQAAIAAGLSCYDDHTVNDLGPDGWRAWAGATRPSLATPAPNNPG